MFRCNAEPPGTVTGTLEVRYTWLALPTTTLGEPAPLNVAPALQVNPRSVERIRIGLLPVLFPVVAINSVPVVRSSASESKGADVAGVAPEATIVTGGENFAPSFVALILISPEVRSSHEIHVLPEASATIEGAMF